GTTRSARRDDAATPVSLSRQTRRIVALDPEETERNGRSMTMLIRTMQQLESEGRIVSISHGKSTAVRLLTKADGLAFSISEARAEKAGQAELWYKNHWEANYVRAGRATLEDRTTGQRWSLEPGVLYCVGPKDKHHIIRDDAR